ncbi:MAG: ParA family protein [Hyphomicrobium sp.]
MRTLVVASAKGGVGKTTLATALAVEAAKTKRVAVIDLDPQQSAARFLDLRDMANPRLVTHVADLAEALDLLVDDGVDLVAIDTAPASLSNLVPAVAAADLVLVPVRPSPLDVEASDVMVELIRKSGRPFAFVINGASPGSVLVEGTREMLAEHGPVLAATITHTDVHPIAMIRGRTAAEIDKSGLCARELSTLWSEVSERLAPLKAKPKRGRT